MVQKLILEKNLFERNNIDAIIGLPANIFFGTGIPTIIMVLKQKRTNTDVLIIDASKGFIKVGKNNKLQESDIKKIVDTVKNRVSIPKYSRIVSKDEIRQNDYNLNIPRYVDSSDKPESFDIYATMYGGIPNKEIDELNEYWNAFPSLKNQLFSQINSSYSSCEIGDIKSAIEKNEDVLKFVNNFNYEFDNFSEYLNTELIKNILSVIVAKEENEITHNIFDRLKNIKLIDKYKAYQLFSNYWPTIAQDIETIQTDGLDTITKVEPNNIIKKKNDKEVEVQDGYKGLILPFDLVQENLLNDYKSELQELENELTSIGSSYDEILESIDEEDKGDFINEDGTAFVPKEIAKLVKSYKKVKIEEGSLESKIVKVNNLIEEEKKLKKEIKNKTEQLHALTKDTLEKMTIDEGLKFLDIKWNRPIINSIKNLPNLAIKDLGIKVNYLKNKYKDTLLDIETDIKNTSSELNTLIDDLTGDDFDMKGLQELKKMLGGE